MHLLQIQTPTLPPLKSCFWILGEEFTNIYRLDREYTYLPTSGK